MITETFTAESVWYGPVEALVSEIAALRPNPVAYGPRYKRYKYAVKIVGDAETDTSFFTSRREARAEARALAAVYGVPFYGVN